MAGLFFTSPLLLAWSGCFWLARELAARRCVDRDWRLSWLLACLGFGALLTIIVEVSSLAHCLNRPVVGLLWLVADLILFWAATKLWLRRRSRLAVGEPNMEATPVESPDRLPKSNPQ